MPRFSDHVASTPAPDEAKPEMLLLDRRKSEQPSLRREHERRRAVPGHAVQLGPSPERPDWVVARCSCGQHAESGVEELVEAWVVCHRWDSKRPD